MMGGGRDPGGGIPRDPPQASHGINLGVVGEFCRASPAGFHWIHWTGRDFKRIAKNLKESAGFL